MNWGFFQHLQFTHKGKNSSGGDFFINKSLYSEGVLNKLKTSLQPPHLNERVLPKPEIKIMG